MAEQITATIKKIEQNIEASKESQTVTRLFPDIDLKAAPVEINAVETENLTPTEAAYYFASTASRTKLRDKQE